MTSLAREEEQPDSSGFLTALESNNVVSWQHERTNLGLLLAPLLRVSGWQGNVLALVDALPIGRRLILANDLLSVMTALGFNVSTQTCRISDLEASQIPGLFIPHQARGWQQGMVLVEKSDLGLIWDDGRTQHKEIAEDRYGTYYRFERTPAASSEEQAEAASTQTDWLRQFRERFNPLIWHALWLSFIVHMFSLAMPIFSMVVYDRVIGARATDTLPLLTAGVVGALAVEMVIRWFRLRIAAWIGTRSGIMVTAALFERLLYLPAPIIEQASISAQIARIRAFETVRDFITGPLFLSLLEAPFIVVLLLAIGWLSGPVIIVPIFTLAAYGLLILGLRRKWRIQGRTTAHTAAQKQQMLTEITSNLKLIQMAGMTDRLEQRLMATTRKASQAQAEFNHTSSLIQFTAALLTIVSVVVMVNWNLERIWAGYMTGGALVATMILNWRLMNLMQTACSVLPQLEQVYAAIQQVRQIMNLKPERHADHAVTADISSGSRIQLHNVGLRYSRKTDPVFMGLTAEIKPGQIIAIYGANGSGKSSILKLLLGLYAPVIGNIRLDGSDYRQLDPRQLRRDMAYFSQSQEMLPGTIADNLRFIDPLAPDHKLRQALMWSDAWDAIAALPNGINTVIGEHGLVLPEGLVARIRLARLYLSERPIILCDEIPTPLLNNETGERFRQFLERCRGNRTVIFVAQREDWLEFADQVIWLRPDGRPVIGKPNIASKAHQAGNGDLA